MPELTPTPKLTIRLPPLPEHLRGWHALETIEDLEEEEEDEFLDSIEGLEDVDGTTLAGEQDQLDVPDWLVEEGEKSVRSDPNYVFCPAQHRSVFLRLFTRHFTRHPLLLDPSGPMSAEEIRTVAVWEMYSCCYQRGLTEVWAYMWTSWYQPKMWALWARSSSAKFLSRLRTTMTVENFWRQFKYLFLHNAFRPRLDRLTWIIITNVIPAYMDRANRLESNYRVGRSAALTSRQK